MGISGAQAAGRAAKVKSISSGRGIAASSSPHVSWSLVQIAGCSVQHVKYHSRLHAEPESLTFYRLFHMFSIHVWPPTFSQSESRWLAPPPMHYPCCLSEGFSHLCVTSNLRSLADRRATRRLYASRLERYNSTPRPRFPSAGTLTRPIRMDAAQL
jgi:hypothetical protein